MERVPRKVLLIPGLFYPRWMLLPLRYTLRKKGFEAEIWDTTGVAAPLPKIVAELVDAIRGFASPARQPDGIAWQPDGIARQPDGIARQPAGVSLVTHSFGDWLARAALAEIDGDGERPSGVDRIVSLVPVIAQSPAAQLAAPLFGRWLPPLEAMSDPKRAAQGLPLPAGIERKIIWARGDLLLRRAPPQTDARTREVYLWTTHNLLLADPRVHRMVGEFLRDPQPCQKH
ncbi:lipase family protein [Candidatus Laterigemmans baculatus]|uniref:hypothetical protein n=1 Tax=Candidatus Laterigemmans baculatus TaxID=2770505 RepID=UPI0013D9699B|nr:hypothetical protein [Candidatus Laterigemmans baculatus]